MASRASRDSETICMADDKPPLPRRLVESIARTSVESTAWAGATATAGGTGLAIGSAAAAPVLTRLGHAFIRHLERRARQVLEPAVHVLGEDELEELLDGNPAMAALVVRAVDHAARMIDEEHVRALAAVLRDALQERIVVDTALSLMDVLGRMRPTTVVVLHHLGRSPEVDSGHYVKTISGQTGIPVGIVRGDLRLLEEAGAATAGEARTDGGELWRIETGGNQLLRYLDDAGHP